MLPIFGVRVLVTFLTPKICVFILLVCSVSVTEWPPFWK